MVLNWIRLSYYDFDADPVRLQLFVLAYNLGSFLRRRYDRPCVPVTFQGWPLHGVKTTVIQYEATWAYLAFCVVM